MSYEYKGRTRDRVAAESGRRPGKTRSPRDPGPAPASGSGRGSRSGSEARQPIHGFAAAVGLAFLLVGIAGFIPGLTSNYDQLEFAGRESGAKLFGLFQVSIVHNIVHLLFAVGLIAAARYSWSRLYLLGGGIAYLGVALYGVLVDHESDANFLPINDADTLLHVGLAFTMLVLGLVGVRLARGR
ncbi:MAG: DUF4383 domain-containing protein [Acidimicrobiales bacterium]